MTELKLTPLQRAKNEDDTRVKFLRKRNEESATKVIDVIEVDDRPSAASALAIFRYKPKFIQRVKGWGVTKEDFLFVTIIPGWAEIPLDKFSRTRIWKLKRRLQRTIGEKKGDSFHGAVFVTDFTVNEMLSETGLKYSVQVHWHGFVHKSDKSVIEGIRKNNNFRSKSVQRPIHFRPISDLDHGADYSMKYCWRAQRLRLRTSDQIFTKGKKKRWPGSVGVKLLTAVADLQPKQLIVRVRPGERSGTHNKVSVVRKASVPYQPQMIGRSLFSGKFSRKGKQDRE